MKRRDFLKMMCVSPLVVPSVLMVKSIEPEVGVWNGVRFHTTNHQEYPLGKTLEVGSGLSYRKYRYCKAAAN